MSTPLSTGGTLPASPRVLGVVGVGLIGASVALAARRRWPDVRIIGVDRPPVLLHPTVAAVLDLAAPIDAICATLPQLPAMAPQARLILDTGSTKRSVMAAARTAGLGAFVGGHPMAGAARGGADLARADFFDGRLWFLVEGADADAVTIAHRFVEGLGARPQRVDADTHDRILAAVSHLPQVVASVLMTRVADAAGPEGLQWSGGGLRDTTRLALSGADMWSSLLASNADYVAPLLIAVSDTLRDLAGHLEDPDAVARVFDAAAAARAHLDQLSK
jgi:prephenate dehydrogenase